VPGAGRRARDDGPAPNPAQGSRPVTGLPTAELGSGTDLMSATAGPPEGVDALAPLLPEHGHPYGPVPRAHYRASGAAQQGRRLAADRGWSAVPFE
jgi:hypothetical protein